jgi:CRISPR-associated protein Csh1
MQDSLGLNLLFLRKDQSAERILLLIEDVLPSRLNLIYNAKLKVEKNFKDYLFATSSESEKKEEKKNIWEKYPKSFNFGKIRTFFSKSNEDKRDTDLDKYFLEVTEAVFKGKTIDWNFLTRFFMNSISSAFVKEEYFRFRVTDAMMVNNFLEELGLINYSKEEQMEASTFEEIFERYGKSLNTPSKRGIFLLGALTQMLLNLQYHLRSSAPFMKKLKSLKMNEQDIRGLLAEVQNKFIEYDRYDVGKRELAKEISDLFLQSGEDWKLSIDEMNYYFACGMNLYEKISEIIYSNLKQKEE